MSTIFTKIIKGEIPSYKVAEDEHYYAFLDINPVAEGHTLVIPKVEVDYIFDLEDDTLKGLIAFSKKVAKAIDAALVPIRTGVIVEGMEVPHAHIHLVPIYFDGQDMSLKRKVEVEDERMKAVAEMISKEFEE